MNKELLPYLENPPFVHKGTAAPGLCDFTAVKHMREAAKEIKKLKKALQTIMKLSDSEMKDGDAAREIAAKTLGF